MSLSLEQSHCAAKQGRFGDIDPSGILHHTSAMWRAIENAARLVWLEGGISVLAIDNQHWRSLVWKQVGCLHNGSPNAVQPLFHGLFGALIYGGVWVTARLDPLHKERGMDFRYDVIDWLGDTLLSVHPRKPSLGLSRQVAFNQNGR